MKPDLEEERFEVHKWDHKQGKFVPADDPAAASKEPRGEVEVTSESARFLKGRIPWNWVVRAAQLGRNSLIIGLCLWRLKGATGKNTIFLSNSEVEPFQIDRAAKSRALRALEEAGLIAVKRQPGRWLIITLLN
jgi:hypothetical protein